MAVQEFTTEELASEIWKPIPGYEGIYAVSDLGRVMRIAGSPKCKRNRILSITPSSKGYVPVHLSVDNKIKGFEIHCLVMLAFVGPCPAGHNVNHIDGIKSNTRLSNLEYATFSENSMHASRLGLMPTGSRHGTRLHPTYLPTGEDHWMKKHPEKIRRGDNACVAKLTEAQVKEIRERYIPRHVTQQALADAYGVSRSLIGWIVTRKIWQHVD